MSPLRPGESREPLPGIESDLDETMAGLLPMSDFVLRFAAAPLIAVSGSDFAHDASAFQPMMFATDGGKSMAVFTARDRAARWVDTAPFSATVLGRSVFEGLQPGVGLLVNPGFGLGFGIEAGGVAAILAAVEAARVPGMPDPAVRLEMAMADARSGDITPEELLDTFAHARVYVLSHSADGVEPITFLRDGAPSIVGVFTRTEEADAYRDGVEYALSVDAAWLASTLLPGVGIVVNPGSAAPLELPPEVVAGIAAA